MLFIEKLLKRSCPFKDLKYVLIDSNFDNLLSAEATGCVRVNAMQRLVYTLKSCHFLFFIDELPIEK